MARPSLNRARSHYVHRFTMEYVPAWAREVRPDGTYFAPQYRSDLEWYENTTFPSEPGHLNGRHHCHSTGLTWPMGQSLKTPYRHP